MPKRLSPAGGAVLALLFAVACSNSSAGITTAPAPANQPAASQPTAGQPPTSQLIPSPTTGGASAAISADVPDVEVVDVASGAKVRLRSLLPGAKPVLLWFWAPH